jgi:hypothetical protein
VHALERAEIPRGTGQAGRAVDHVVPVVASSTIRSSGSHGHRVAFALDAGILLGRPSHIEKGLLTMPAVGFEHHQDVSHAGKRKLAYGLVQIKTILENEAWATLGTPRNPVIKKLKINIIKIGHEAPVNVH